MKNIILVLSLLFSVSGFGDDTHPYQNLIDAQSHEDICRMYDKDGYIDDYTQTCHISSFSLSESVDDTKYKQICSSLFGATFDGFSCIVPVKKLETARNNCINKGYDCPHELHGNTEPTICQNLDVQKDCNLNYYNNKILTHDVLNSLILSFLESQNNVYHSSSCSKAYKLNLIGARLNQQKIGNCSKGDKVCDYYCSEDKCKRLGYKDKIEALEKQRIVFKENHKQIGICRKNTDDSNSKQQNTREVLDTVLGDSKVSAKDRDKLSSQIDDGNIEKQKTRIAHNKSNDSQGVSENQSESEAQNKVTIVKREQNKFKQNKAHVNTAFNKINQQMADRMNKGKATKEDRKPNLVASANNDNSLSNKKKNNKYLVASRNDSFLTQKDIFKTVSNAYYKMCQTDSCYGIVKK